MKMKCLCCGNESADQMFEADTFTKCMICGETAIEYTKEESDKEELVFVD